MIQSIKENWFAAGILAGSATLSVTLMMVLGVWKLVELTTSIGG